MKNDIPVYGGTYLIAHIFKKDSLLKIYRYFVLFPRNLLHRESDYFLFKTSDWEPLKQGCVRKIYWLTFILLDLDMFNRNVSNEDTEADSFNLSYSDFFNSVSNSDLMLFRLSVEINLLLRGTLKPILTVPWQAKNDTV